MPNVVEFQLPMPLSLDEYRIAHLYMIAKFSRNHSEESQSKPGGKSEKGGKDAGKGDEAEGVEILVNEPYDADPENGLPFAGQYTHKIIHFSSSVAPWLRAVLPASALQIHEKSWSAFPHFSRTVYHSEALGDRFKLSLDTISLDDDCCSTENAHGLEGAELKRRKIDVVDIVSDAYPADKYKEEEDPKVFHSEKTGRGPLSDDWVELARQLLARDVDPELDALGLSSGSGKKSKKSKRASKDDSSSSSKQKKDQKKKKGKRAAKEEKDDAPHPICTAYKVSRCEVKMFGLGGKIENFVNGMTRNILLHGHRQAYAWMDEWYGMDIDDIREFEEETARALERLRHGGDSDEDEEEEDKKEDEDAEGESSSSSEGDDEGSTPK
jgi:membrane-associated phosphatidylinositol transfer protein